MVVVRRIVPEDADALREVRLAALVDSPQAFAVTAEEDGARPREAWEQWAAAGAAGTDQATFVAATGAGLVGLVGGFRDEGTERAHLVAMWVAPQHRRSGIGVDLCGAVIEWAAESGYGAVSLWVVIDNAPARSLYRDLGFRPTGDAQPLPSDPDLIEERWELSLR